MKHPKETGTHVIGIDPGLRRGTGIALVDVKQRKILRARTIIADGPVIAGFVRAWAVPEEFALSYPVDLAPSTKRLMPIVIEKITPMGAYKGSASAATLENAELVGHIRGFLEAWGFTVILVSKREVLSGIGVKGKASTARVHKVASVIFRPAAGRILDLGDHEIDAALAAFVGARRIQ